MRGQQDDEPEPLPRQAASDRHRDGGQRAGAKRERSVLVQVPISVADTLSGRQDGPESLRDVTSDHVGQERVGSNRQMPAMMLDRAERHDCGPRALVEQLTHRGGGQLLELVQAPITSWAALVM